MLESSSGCCCWRRVVVVMTLNDGLMGPLRMIFEVMVARKTMDCMVLCCCV